MKQVQKTQDVRWSWTVWRPPIVCGLASGKPLNVMVVLGVHAAVSRERGEPLRYPGGVPGALTEVVEARLIGEAMEWAALNCENPAVANQQFNITNGDVVVWEGIYHKVAEAFGISTGEPLRQSLAEWARQPENQQTWDEVV